MDTLVRYIDVVGMVIKKRAIIVQVLGMVFLKNNHSPHGSGVVPKNRRHNSGVGPKNKIACSGVGGLWISATFLKKSFTKKI